MTHVMIVEDDAEMRAAIAASVAACAELTVQSAVGSVAEALIALEQNPEVLLVDLGLPDGAGQDVIRAAAARRSPPEIMVITVFGDEKNVVSAIEAGAAGYLLKDSDTRHIADAISDLIGGGSPITPLIARHILRCFRPPARIETIVDSDETIPQLTPRETEVLQMVARGYTNSEIAELLTISFHTVTSHIRHIYRKLSVRSRSEAVFEASQLGIIRI